MGIRVENLTKRFPKVLAVDNLSFECREGEVFGLLGPNGAGKTTTIRMILGILEPTDGRVFIDGNQIDRDSVETRMRIGAVLEENGVYDRLTAEENVLIFAEYHGIPKIKANKKLEDLFTLLEMNEFRKRLGKEFSRGMRQKVAVARALISDPSILILDEPTEGLDVPTRRAILDMIKKERDSGKCILYSTHVMSEAEEVCDRIGIIYQGKLHYIGPLEELKKSTNAQTLEEAFLRVVKESFLKGD